MSWEIIAYINDVKNINKADCERYLLQLGINAQMHPETEIETASGFLPFKAEFTSIGFLKGKDFLSGFEIYIGAYDYEKELSELKEFDRSSKTGGILGLFKKKQTPPEKIYIINPEADELLKSCGHKITMSVQSVDSLEPILAFAFASYLAETHGGVVYDTYDGDYIYNDIKRKILERINEMIDEVEVLNEMDPNEMELHPFERW